MREAEVAKQIALSARTPHQKAAWLMIAADWLSLVTLEDDETADLSVAATAHDNDNVCS